MLAEILKVVVGLVVIGAVIGLLWLAYNVGSALFDAAGLTEKQEPDFIQIERGK